MRNGNGMGFGKSQETANVFLLPIWFLTEVVKHITKMYIQVYNSECYHYTCA